MGSVFIMVLFGSLLGLVTPDNKGTMIAFLFLSQTGFGWALYLSIAITQMGVEQKNLGVSGGISGCVRYAAGASKSIFCCPMRKFIIPLHFIIPSISLIHLLAINSQPYSRNRDLHHRLQQHLSRLDRETRPPGRNRRRSLRVQGPGPSFHNTDKRSDVDPGFQPRCGSRSNSGYGSGVLQGDLVSLLPFGNWIIHYTYQQFPFARGNENKY